MRIETAEAVIEGLKLGFQPSVRKSKHKAFTRKGLLPRFHSDDTNYQKHFKPVKKNIITIVDMGEELNTHRTIGSIVEVHLKQG